MLDKKALRRQYRQQRQKLSQAYRTQAEQQILQYWHDWPLALVATHIGSYCSTAHEVPTQCLHQLIWQRQQHLFLPLVTQYSPVLAACQVNTPLVKTKLGIEQPQSNNFIDVARLDLLIVPLLAIDSQGYRLGYGSGFYDRLLAKLDRRPLLIGLGFQQQRVDVLPHDVWDIPLDAFLSDVGWLFFSQPQATV